MSIKLDAQPVRESASVGSVADVLDHFPDDGLVLKGRAYWRDDELDVHQPLEDIGISPVFAYVDSGIFEHTASDRWIYVPTDRRIGVKNFASGQLTLAFPDAIDEWWSLCPNAAV